MATSGNGPTVTRTLNLDRHARYALEELFHRGYRGPIVDPSDPRQPKPHSIVTFNLPRKCVPNNAKTLYDIFAGTSLHHTTLSSYTKILGMLSLCMTQPLGGFGNQASPGVDKRGEVVGNGQQLLFEHQGNRYNRSIQCIEDLTATNGHVVGHRIWIFILDPALNVGQSLKDITTSNQTIYHSRLSNGATGVAEGDPYVQHAQVYTESHLYDLFAIFVADGVKSCNFQQHAQRSHFRSLEATLSSMARGADHNGRSLVDKDSLVHPTAVLSPLAAFTFHTERVCEIQRDINNYFHLPAFDTRDAEAESDAENAMDTDDNNDADNSEEIDLFAEEEMAIDRQLRISDLDHTDDGNDEDETDDKMIPRSAADFMQFPCPDLVQRIPIFLFGRKFMNVPLRITYSNRNSAGDEIDLQSLGLEVMEANLNLEPSLRDLSDARQRRNRLEHLHRMHVESHFQIGDENYFPFEASEIDFESDDSCIEMMRNIYKCFVINDDRIQIQRSAIEIRRLLETSKRVLLHDEAVVNVDDGAPIASALPVPLPEICSEEGVTMAEIEHFSKTDDFLKLRLELWARYNELILEHVVGSPEFVQAIADFRREGAEKFWTVFLESKNIPQPIQDARAFFQKLKIYQQWPEHFLLSRDLSAFANLMQLYLSRYNEIFRGASTQTIFLLLYTISINTSMYHFGLRPNALLTGDGGTGKSFPMLAVEALVAPGTFKAYTHVTSKAFSTSKAFTDRTFCMHEASRDMIGVDDRGFDNTGDPVFKDRLTRQRSGTLAFGQDESGQRITIEQETMSMFNHILATNDAIPDETKALMQRFINIPVHYTKRLGFNKGDQSHVSSSEVNSRMNAKHKLASQVFSFYCLVVEKMIECWVIPEPSMDCANAFMREILRIYSKDTGIDGADPRKRTMVTHLMRTGAVMNAVHVALCSPLSDNVRYKVGPDGVKRMQPFHPQMIVDHVMKRLFVTDEIVVFYMTMCSFMWEPRNQYDILNTFVSVMNGAPHLPASVLDKKSTSFRYVKNPRYKPYRSRGGKNTTFSIQGLSSSGTNNGNSEEEEEPEFLIDTGYVSLTTNAINLAYTKISQMAIGSRPSTTEIRRVLNSLKKTWRPLHKSRIVPCSDEEVVARNTHVSYDNDNDNGSDEPDLDGLLSDSENGNSIADTMRGASAATIGTGRRHAGDKSLTQEQTYLKGSFRWECDQTTIKDRSAPVVIFEADPRGRSNKVVISVMIEALLDDTFKNGIKRAIVKFMEKSNVPPSGRRILTANDYQRRNESGDVIEIMPQYKDVIDLKPTSQPMILRHMPIGTDDSNAFINSTLNLNPADLNPAQVIMRHHLGTRLDEPPNAHYARIHWRACDLAPSDEWQTAMPEHDTEKILAIQARYSSEQSRSLYYINNYPEGPVKMELRRRMTEEFMDEYPEHEAFDEFLVTGKKYHERATLAAMVRPLDYCHFDFESGTVKIHSTATEEQREHVRSLENSIAAFAKPYTVQNTPRPVQQVRTERLASERSIRVDGLHKMGKKFHNRLEDLMQLAKEVNARSRSEHAEPQKTSPSPRQGFPSGKRKLSLPPDSPPAKKQRKSGQFTVQSSASLKSIH